MQQIDSVKFVECYIKFSVNSINSTEFHEEKLEYSSNAVSRRNPGRDFRSDD